MKKSQKGKKGVERRREPKSPKLGREGWIWISVQGPFEFRVTPLLMGPVCLLSQGRFEQPVRPFLSTTLQSYPVYHVIVIWNLKGVENGRKEISTNFHVNDGFWVEFIVKKARWRKKQRWHHLRYMTHIAVLRLAHTHNRPNWRQKLGRA